MRQGCPSYPIPSHQRYEFRAHRASSFVSARRAILQAVRPSGLQRQCDRAKGSQRRPGETTPTLSSSIFFRNAISSAQFRSLSRRSSSAPLALRARRCALRFCVSEPEASHQIRRRARARVFRIRNKIRGSVEHALPSGVALGRAIAARCLSCIIVIAHSLHAATSGVPTQGSAIRIIS